ncbi:MAG: HEPN domain-containing protein [Chloroflexi bacterium]|nr:HEPN domain-containing protein [Chloroflexota bacterium]
MRSREQVIWDFVQAWLEKAARDLRAAEVLLAESNGWSDIVAFHCQQAVEKVEKAFLVRHQIEFRKTHDIAAIRSRIALADASLAERLAFADWLTPFGVETRYPGAVFDISPETAARAVRDARAARDLVLESLQPYLRCGRPS